MPISMTPIYTCDNCGEETPPANGLPNGWIEDTEKEYGLPKACWCSEECAEEYRIYREAEEENEKYRVFLIYAHTPQAKKIMGTGKYKTWKKSESEALDLAVEHFGVMPTDIMVIDATTGRFSIQLSFK